ncbi:fungal-specific transcription factor domain-containing protein [Lineolata rhizophorae]|uniref:Fungal-specific transcription factor domain-containing protein n=1 Tax=Lineolata rhizophorae TaxID=578093 RepID=A0A6A6P3X6_9PEZI|nr:fungal-specific transcription factor domain-containing protein [Lineolata rhizophorae]
MAAALEPDPSGSWRKRPRLADQSCADLTSGNLTVPLDVPEDAFDVNAQLWVDGFDAIGDLNIDPRVSPDHTRKRKCEAIHSSPAADQELQQWLPNDFQGFIPATPRQEERIVPLVVPNPFLDDYELSPGAIVQHPIVSEQRAPVRVSEGGVLDGLIKVQLRAKATQDKYKQSIGVSSPHKASRVMPTLKGVLDMVPYLPRDFGGAKLDATDAKLFNFFLVAVCGGRTVISDSNMYLQQIAPMVCSSPLVRHAVLALSISYVLDFSRTETLEARANLHYKRAIHLLGSEVNNALSFAPGNEDAIVGAICMLVHNECVNWEMRNGALTPKWFRAIQLAKSILSASSPGFRYQSPSNVQFSQARFQLANRVGLEYICSSLVAPLEFGDNNKCDFPWLLLGSERELRKVIGTTGFSSKLMHTLAQITHLSARLANDPTSTVIPAIASKVIERLENFWQWSDLSEGYSTSQELIAAAETELDGNGKVTTPTKVTELIAESYSAAAQIYAHCRLLRKPRNHPLVQDILSRLCRYIDWMPTSGPLFTAQAPLLSVFIAGTVAFRPESRRIVRDWMESVSSGTRGNVPPAWRAMQFLWAWMDADQSRIFDGQGYVEEPFALVGFLPTWWEAMVNELSQREGRLNLS